MRHRLGNPFREHHFRPMHVFDWIAPATDPHSVSQAIEYVIPDLCVFGRGTVVKERVWVRDHFEGREVQMQDFDPTKQGWVNGAVWTSWHLDPGRDEPVLYVALGLYETPCADPHCPAGHMNGPCYEYRVAPRLQRWQREAIAEEVGELPGLRLGVRPDRDATILAALGYTALDAPCRA